MCSFICPIEYKKPHYARINGAQAVTKKKKYFFFGGGSKFCDA